MYEIAKEFDFCYGHRVFTQNLDPELSCNMPCKCRHFHGHQGKIIIFLSGENVDERGMIIDFNELQWFKRWLDDVLDHKMILSISDPALYKFYPILAQINVLNSHKEGYFTIKSEDYASLPSHEQEIYDGLILVDFVPTSENLSKWIWKIVNERIGYLCTVSRVQFYETPKSQSNYINY